MTHHTIDPDHVTLALAQAETLALADLKTPENPHRTAGALAILTKRIARNIRERNTEDATRNLALLLAVTAKLRAYLETNDIPNGEHAYADNPTIPLPPNTNMIDCRNCGTRTALHAPQPDDEEPLDPPTGTPLFGKCSFCSQTYTSVITRNP